MRRAVALAAAVLLFVTAGCSGDVGEAAIDDAGTEELLPVCQPRAASWARHPPPEIPAPGLEAGCEAVSYEVDLFVNEGFDYSWHFWREGNTTHFEQRGLDDEYVYESVRRTVDDQGRLVRVTARHAEWPGDTWRYRRWEFDAAERLVRFEENDRFTDTRLFVEQDWQDGRLVERRVGPGDGHNARTRWYYDDRGRLERTTHHNRANRLIAEVSWRYDGAGRNIEVIRRLDGTIASRQSWQWSAEGRLERREGSYDLGGAIAGVEFNHSPAYSLRHLDNFEPAPLHYAIEGFDAPWDPWLDAMTEVEDGCRRPPTSVGHGYPAADEHYLLGFVFDRRPWALGYAYAGGGPLFIGGAMSWYGLGGPGDLELVTGDASVEYAVTYDAQGRMVTEAFTPHGDAEDVAGSQGRQRVRQFDAAGLARDTVTLADGTTYELRFERDPDGRLVERRRFVDGELVGHQSWTWEDDRRVGHVVRVIPDERSRPEGAEPGEMAETASFAVGESDLDGDGTQEPVVGYYDPHGQLVEEFAIGLDPRDFVLQSRTCD